jgi:hypothetical protein
MEIMNIQCRVSVFFAAGYGFLFTAFFLGPGNLQAIIQTKAGRISPFWDFEV